MKRLLLASTAMWLVVFVTAAFALEVASYSSPVTDLEGILSTEAQQALVQKLLDYRAQSGNEIGVLIVPSLEGEALEDFAHSVFQTWGIGSKETKKGVLFLMSVRDKKARIEVGYGLEGELTDSEAGRLIRRDSPMAQQFRNGDWDAGIAAVVDGMISAIGGEYNPAPARGRNQVKYLPFGFVVLLVVVGLFIFYAVVQFLRRNAKGYDMRDPFVAATILGALLGSRGRGKHDDWHWGSGGGGFGSSGGGGGFSFGGGSSGGGGASGGW